MLTTSPAEKCGAMSNWNDVGAVVVVKRQLLAPRHDAGLTGGGP
jgi:hypothetical protein